jgi:transposase
MNSAMIFSLALGIESPWVITNIEFLETGSTEKELHIHLDFERGFRFKTSTGECATAYDTENKRWQHLNFFQHRYYLHARVPRIKDKNGKITTVEVPWSRPGSGFTLLFEAYAMLLIESEMPVNKVSDCVGATAPRIWRVFDYWIARAVANDRLGEVRRIGMDETSRKKGHSYVTQFVDLEARRTIFVTEGKDASTVDAFVEELEKRGGRKEGIELVSMDMSAAFISGALSNLPEAQLVFDKFHLVQSLNKALDEVRKAERKGNELLKGHRYTILRKHKNLSKAKQAELDMLLPLYPTLGEAYRLRELFLDVFEIPEAEEAKGYLWFWCDKACDAGILPIAKFANSVKAHWSGITAYFETKVTNGILEGINSKIQLAKRRARGYRNPRNFINMIYFISGKLKFDYPPYSL